MLHHLADAVVYQFPYDLFACTQLVISCLSYTNHLWAPIDRWRANNDTNKRSNLLEALPINPSGCPDIPSETSKDWNQLINTICHQLDHPKSLSSVTHFYHPMPLMSCFIAHHLSSMYYCPLLSHLSFIAHHLSPCMYNPPIFPHFPFIAHFWPSDNWQWSGEIDRGTMRCLQWPIVFEGPALWATCYLIPLLVLPHRLLWPF